MDSNNDSGVPAKEEENLDTRTIQSSSSSIASFSTCSDHSDTSTWRYDQEPWSLYRHRVEKLCETLWPAQKTLEARLVDNKLIARLRAVKLLSKILPRSQKPILERMEGGDYNRITGITLPHSRIHEPRQLILRAPREKELARPERDVGILTYVGRRSSIPVATVAKRDYTCNNPLESPYVLQNRIEGQDLEKLWPTLTHSQRCTIAAEVGGVIRKLFALESNTPGSLSCINEYGKPHHLEPFELKMASGDNFNEPEKFTLPEHQTTYEFFTAQFLRWRAVDFRRSGGEITRDVELWDGLLQTVQEMNDMNLFPEDLGNCLCHVDLHPRNIMVSIQPDDSLKVTAILDWDESVFAPKFVNCLPPLWLWKKDDAEDPVDEDGIDPWPYELPGADKIPVHSEQAELKKLFEKHAGPEYPSLAYKEQFRLGRVLFHLATMGLVSSENFKAADRVLKDWGAYRKGKGKEE